MAMTRRTLLDFFSDIASADAPEPDAGFLTYDDGYRTWTWTYADVGRRAQAFAARLRGSGVEHGERVAIWSENRPEWIAAFWGALLEGVVIVPIDYRASAEFLLRVAAIVDAKAILVGDVVDAEALGSDRPVWRLHEVFRLNDRTFRLKAEAMDQPAGLRTTDPGSISADTTAEIIFTS